MNKRRSFGMKKRRRDGIREENVQEMLLFPGKMITATYPILHAYSSIYSYLV
jgi:hypothetical protein